MDRKTEYVQALSPTEDNTIIVSQSRADRQWTDLAVKRLGLRTGYTHIATLTPKQRNELIAALQAVDVSESEAS